MNRNPILFRLDGTSAHGWERLNRCLTFAAALQRRRRPTYFLSNLEPRSLGLAVKRSGCEWLDTEEEVGTSEDAAEVVQEIRRLKPAALIVDAPNATQPYLTELCATGTLVVSIDHLAQTRFPSNLLINPLLAPNRDSYDFCPGTQLLLGPRYALVRPEFRRARPIRSQDPPAPFSALVALADTDLKLKAGEIARQLLNISKIERVDVITRPEHPGFEKLQQLAEANPDRLKLAVEPAELMARLGRCHFAVTAGGTWSLEMACVGVPQLLLVQSEAHLPNAQRLEEEGAATCLGWHEDVTANALRQAVQNLLNDPLERQAMARCGRQLIDGRGPDRLVTALEVMLHPSRLVQFGEAA